MEKDIKELKKHFTSYTVYKYMIWIGKFDFDDLFSEYEDLRFLINHIIEYEIEDDKAVYKMLDHLQELRRVLQSQLFPYLYAYYKTGITIKNKI